MSPLTSMQVYFKSWSEMPGGHLVPGGHRDHARARRRGRRRLPMPGPETEPATAAAAPGPTGILQAQSVHIILEPSSLLVTVANHLGSS
jgi:hypothetical protein